MTDSDANRTHWTIPPEFAALLERARTRHRLLMTDYIESVRRRLWPEMYATHPLPPGQTCAFGCVANHDVQEDPR